MKNGSIFVVNLNDECEAIQLVKEPSNDPPKGLLINIDSFIAGMSSIEPLPSSDGISARISHILKYERSDDFVIFWKDSGEPLQKYTANELDEIIGVGWRDLILSDGDYDDTWLDSKVSANGV